MRNAGRHFSMEHPAASPASPGRRHGAASVRAIPVGPSATPDRPPVPGVGAAAGARRGWAAGLRRRLFGIAPDEATVARRGFDVRDPAVRARLEAIGEAFLDGYHAALECRDERSLGERLDATDAERRGFAYEGAAMGLLLLDAVTPWARGRWLRFARGPGAAHIYMVHVGAGWALARLPGGFRRAWLPFDPLLSWLAYDGYGFHEGYFHRERRLAGGETPATLTGYARRAFDQGLGRSLWFCEGADPGRIGLAIAGLAPERRADLWSGVGLAAAYAGGAGEAALEALPRLAGTFAPHVAQGAAFAAKARDRAGNAAPHTALACRALCGMEAGAAARVTDEALAALPADGDVPSFEAWRARVRGRFAGVFA